MTRNDIINAYIHLRKTDHTISDDVLDFMYQSALARLDSHNVKLDKYIDRIIEDYPEKDKIHIDLQQFAKELMNL